MFDNYRLLEYNHFMKNQFDSIPAKSEFRNQITVRFEESQEAVPIKLMKSDVNPQNDDGNFGYPGDGFGTDDLADYNRNEGMDYANE